MHLRQFLVFLTTAFVSFSSFGAILFKGGTEQSQSRHTYDQTGEAQLVSQFWSKRKMGVGVVTAGAYGLIGGQVGIHFHPQWSMDLGFGGGSHFQSFGFRFKKMLLMSSRSIHILEWGFSGGSGQRIVPLMRGLFRQAI